MKLIRCSGHCGDGVNTNFFEKYKKMITNKCKAYNGPNIKVSCANYQLFCSQEVCEYARVGLLRVFDD